MWKPVFRDGELICFVGNHIHNTDVGGAVPASLSRSLTEVHQEGMRIPPMRLVRDGVINEDLLRMIATNVRLPEQNWGDLNAQIACVNVGERKVHEIIDRFGMDAFRSGLVPDCSIMPRTRPARSSATSRTASTSSPTMPMRIRPAAIPCRVAMTLRIRGDGLERSIYRQRPAARVVAEHADRRQ